MSRKPKRAPNGDGQIFDQGRSWFLRYREDLVIDGQVVRKQRCVKLAEKCDRFRIKSDLKDLAADVMNRVKQSAKCPNASIMFTDYVEQTYLPYAERTTKVSTYACRKTYFNRYIKPRVEELALRDFTKAHVYQLLDDITKAHSLNTSTVSKVRSILYNIFNYAICKGEFPSTNPAADVLMPESATAPERTEAATFGEVKAILAALKNESLARAAVAIMAYTGVRPGEARGLRWEEWDRAAQHIAVNRSVWHGVVGSTKTEQSIRFVTVTEELRTILLDLWNAQHCPIKGYVLAGERKGLPLVLDNVAKRVIRPTLEKAGLVWKGWYSLRRFHGTQVRMNANSSETAAKALGNSKEVFDKHYSKPTAVLPDVRRAVNEGFSGLVQ
jgi:integrase